MEALCITLVLIPRSFALSNKSACVVALQKQTHMLLMAVTVTTLHPVVNQHQSNEGSLWYSSNFFKLIGIAIFLVLLFINFLFLNF